MQRRVTTAASSTRKLKGLTFTFRNHLSEFVFLFSPTVSFPAVPATIIQLLPVPGSALTPKCRTSPCMPPEGPRYYYNFPFNDVINSLVLRM
jgi:hypothetical protein